MDDPGVNETNQDTHTPEAGATPRRDLSRGLRSLAILAILGSVSAFAGIIAVHSSGSAGMTDMAHATPAPPPLAATLFTATDMMDPGPALDTTTGVLKSRETLSELVTRLGAPPAESASAIHALLQTDLIDARRLRPGLQAETYLRDGSLESLTIRAEPGRNVFVKRLGNGDWSVSELNARLSPTFTRIAAPIETSIYETARQLGAGDQQVVDFASAFAYDIDFQREIHPGDSFELVYETMVDERGNPIRAGDLIYARLNGRALTRGFYRFTPSDDGVSDYFDENGESATKFLMKTPINGARLSSSFGNRRHPISGYTRLHKGTDFAAPTGTPVFAAGNGVIERASRYGGYGNYIRIRHANGYKTAYAHLSRYARGIRSGKRVRQGDIIGYVGSTGASTGPHLHYEVYIKGKPVNAMTLKLPTGRKLAETPEVLTEFMDRKAEIDAIRATHGAELAPLVAVSNTPSP